MQIDTAWEFDPVVLQIFKPAATLRRPTSDWIEQVRLPGHWDTFGWDQMSGLIVTL